MNIFDAFKTGGLPGAALNAGAKASPTISQATADALFTPNGTGGSKSLFGLGFTDKLMITLVLGTVFVVATSRALR